MAQVEGSEYGYSYSRLRQIRRGAIQGTLNELRSFIAPYRFGLAASEIVRCLNIKSGDNVLEIGSGLGLMGEKIKDLLKWDINFYALDLFLNSAKLSANHGLTSIQSDTVALPYVSESFEHVVSTDVLEHVEDAESAVKEVARVLKQNGDAFIVVADPSEGRFAYVDDHIDRLKAGTDVKFWEHLFNQNGLLVDEENSIKYRNRDWRKIFNLPFLVKFKDKPGLACAFNPVNRPGVYVLNKIG
jgi:SAM-dependent methyltransferase